MTDNLLGMVLMCKDFVDDIPQVHFASPGFTQSVEMLLRDFLHRLSRSKMVGGVPIFHVNMWIDQSMAMHPHPSVNGPINGTDKAIRLAFLEPPSQCPPSSFPGHT